MGEYDGMSTEEKIAAIRAKAKAKEAEPDPEPVEEPEPPKKKDIPWFDIAYYASLVTIVAMSFLFGYFTHLLANRSYKEPVCKNDSANLLLGGLTIEDSLMITPEENGYTIKLIPKEKN